MRGDRPTEEVRRQICAEPETMTGPELEQKYGVTAESCKAMRAKAGLATAKARRGGERPGAFGKPEQQQDEQQVSTVAAAQQRSSRCRLWLQRIRPAIRIELEFTQEEMQRFMGRLTDGQRAALFGGGVKALLLG
ncbi:MAG TPA: hypothetical protein VHB45_13005 [Alloacidobacterium sp.]|nr:hypothetical protein [Alloacidobacterium sp.]